MSDNMKGSGIDSYHFDNYNSTRELTCPDCGKDTNTHELYKDDYSNVYVICQHCDEFFDMVYDDE